LRMRVFPIPPKGDHKVAVSFQAVAKKEGKLVQYVYPLKSDGRAVATLEKFSVKATVKSQHGVANVYSPTHALSLRRTSDKEVEQARRALKYCLSNLGPRDRFGLIAFATTVNPYEEKLVEATPEQLNRGRKWVDDLDATGGTAIQEALDSAIRMRPAAAERPF